MDDEARLIVDVGSTGCRATLIDAAGDTLGRSSRDLDPRAHGSRIEYDAGAVVGAVEAVIDEAAEDHRVVEVGLAVQRGSVVCWDRRSGEAISAVISWRDRRTAGEAAPIPPEAIKRLTGLRFSPYAGAPKLAWCRNHLAAVRRAERNGSLVAGPLGSFLATRLTQGAVACVDDTLAQRTLLWSCAAADWDPELLEAFGLPEAILPRVNPGRADFGRVQRLPGRPPLSALTGDQNVVPFIDGRPDIDTLYINLGTGAFLLRPLPDLVESEAFQVSTLGRDRGWALEASVHGVASALTWLEEREGRPVGPRELAALASVPEPPLFINTIDGLGSPWWRNGPDPAFVEAGHSSGIGFEARLLAVIESIAFLVRANVDAMNRLTGPPGRVVIAGGLSRADPLVGRIAALLDTDLLRLHDAEATTLGLCCRLRGRAQGLPAFELVAADSQRAIRARYRRWLETMPAFDAR